MASLREGRRQLLGRTCGCIHGTQLPTADLLTFWFSCFGPYSVMVQKVNLLVPGFFEQLRESYRDFHRKLDQHPPDRQNVLAGFVGSVRFQLEGCSILLFGGEVCSLSHNLKGNLAGPCTGKEFGLRFPRAHRPFTMKVRLIQETKAGFAHVSPAIAHCLCYCWSCSSFVRLDRTSVLPAYPALGCFGSEAIPRRRVG